MVITTLVEGTSVRAVERITGIHRDTICRLLILAGEKCERDMAQQVRNPQVRDVEMDEVLGYIGKKEGHKKADESDVDGLGDAYCFVAIERNTKLVINFSLGKRNQETCNVFVRLARCARTETSVSDHNRWFPSLRQRD